LIATKHARISGTGHQQAKIRRESDILAARHPLLRVSDAG
jgi:hypothetical protein